MADLTRVPLRLASDWRSKTVTTDPPRYTPHQEWSVALTLAASTPIRVAVFLDDGREIAWGLSADPSSTEPELRASFFPYDWSQSDDVQVNFGWQRRTVTDAALKNDPREIVRLTSPDAATTGTVVCLAELPSHGIALSAMAIAETDTERRREGRWRLKPELAAALPEHLRPLASGHQSGVIRR